MTATISRFRSSIVFVSVLVNLMLAGCADSGQIRPLASETPPVTSAGQATTSLPDAAPDLTPAPVRGSSTVPPASSATLPLTPSTTPTPTATFISTPAPTLTPIVTGTSTSFLTATPGPAGNPHADSIEHVLIISIDGLRPDALEQADTPILDSLRARGAYTAAAQTILPGATLISHASMLSGMTPDKHGITWNVHEPILGKINGPTVFSVAHDADLSTAMVVGKPRLEHIVLPSSVDIYDYAGFTDSQVVDHALEIIQTGLPNLLFIHLPDVDTAGHATGWMSTSQSTVISWTDGLIGEILAKLRTEGYLDHTLIIITSDHGGSGFDHGSDSPEDVTIPWLAVGPGVPAGLTLQREVRIYDTASTVLYALELPIPSRWDGQPVLEIFAGE